MSHRNHRRYSSTAEGKVKAQKAAIKREKSQTCLNSSEREQTRRSQITEIYWSLRSKLKQKFLRISGEAKFN